MDPAVFHQAFDTFRSQGPVFWAAAAAIAAGLTILVVSMLVYAQGRFRNWRRARLASARTVLPDPGVYARNSGVADDNFSLPGQTLNPPSAGEGTGPLGESLLLRLRTTVSRLEDLQATLGNQILPADESRLKQGPPAVDYIFKKGVG